MNERKNLHNSILTLQITKRQGGGRTDWFSFELGRRRDWFALKSQLSSTQTWFVWSVRRKNEDQSFLEKTSFFKASNWIRGLLWTKSLDIPTSHECSIRKDNDGKSCQKQHVGHCLICLTEGGQLRLCRSFKATECDGAAALQYQVGTFDLVAKCCKQHFKSSDSTLNQGVAGVRWQ